MKTKLKSKIKKIFKEIWDKIYDVRFPDYYIKDDVLYIFHDRIDFQNDKEFIEITNKILKKYLKAQPFVLKYDDKIDKYFDDCLEFFNKMRDENLTDKQKDVLKHIIRSLYSSDTYDLITISINISYTSSWINDNDNFKYEIAEIWVNGHDKSKLAIIRFDLNVFTPYVFVKCVKVKKTKHQILYAGIVGCDYLDRYLN